MGRGIVGVWKIIRALSVVFNVGFSSIPRRYAFLAWFVRVCTWEWGSNILCRYERLVAEGDHLEDLITLAPSVQFPELQDSERPDRVTMLSIHTSPLASLGGRDTGGMNVYIKQLALELARRGISVDLFTRRSDTATPAVQEVVPGFRTISLSVGPPASVSREALYGLVGDFAHAVDSYVQSDGLEYDVLHSHYWLSGLVGEKLSNVWGMPWAHMSHTLAVLKDAHRGPNQEPESLQRLESENRILRAADGVVASNEIERQELLRRYDLEPSRLHVAPCGVDLSTFNPGSRAEARARLNLEQHEKVILYVGRIEPLKGLDTLFAALALLAKRVSHLRLIVVGGAKAGTDQATEREVARLQRLAGDLGIDHLVEFRGPALQSELPELYRAADLCAVPSRYESFGMVALEALTCGTPVVASRTGGLQSTVRHNVNGYLAPIGDEYAFARYMERILCRPELASGLSQEASSRARRYSWQRVADANIGVYLNLLAPVRAGVPLEIGAEVPI